MLFAHNGDGLRLAAVGAMGIVMLACSTPDIGQAPPSVQAPEPAGTQAADLRTHLDLLLAEQVVIVAKESAAAVNHSDEYAAYTSLLATNVADLSRVIGRAFGNTESDRFAQVLTTQNGYLVDYAIGVVTHDDDKAKAAMSGLNDTFVPRLAQFVADHGRMSLASVKQLATEQVLADKVFIDDVFAGKFSAYYADLHRAYGQTSHLGDELAQQIALDFPDKFPGSTSDPAVDARVALNLLLQERAYLTTMMTDAIVNGRDAETSPAVGALAANTLAMKSMVQDQRFTQAWDMESASSQSYASKGDDQSRKTMTDALVSELSTASKAPRTWIANHVSATIRVIDDQRTKSSKAVANDDRAAATSMQPISDSTL